MIIGISGHRKTLLPENYKEDIYNYLDNFILENGLSKDNITFNLGGAHGVDNTVGKYCIDNNIDYNLYLPFLYNEEQLIGWSNQDIKDFYYVLNNKHCKIVKNGAGYLGRNKEIVDNADIMIVGFLGNYKSGTGYTIKYALKKNKKVYNIYNVQI